MNIARARAAHFFRESSSRSILVHASYNRFLADHARRETRDGRESVDPGFRFEDFRRKGGDRDERSR
jgi:hypothetical protein